MKKRVYGPAIGLSLALFLVGCGGGGSGSEPPPGPPPPPPPEEEVPEPPPPPPPPTSANSVIRVKAAMSDAHDAAALALTGGSQYAATAVVSSAAAPGGRSALGGWGQVLAASGNTATTIRVQLRNFETFAYRQSTGTWTRVQFSHRLAGANFGANYTGGSSAATIKAEPTGGVSVRPTNGQIFRFWPESGVTQSLVPNLADLTSIFTTVQARLISDAGVVGDAGGTARYLVNTGADWWGDVRAASPYSVAASYRAGVANAAVTTRVGAGRLHLVSTTWQAMNFHSGSSTQADALGVSGANGRPLTNSEPFEPRTVRNILPVGDSITQGNQEGASPQDSYRRALWNGLVSDADLPIIDFVGTRVGTLPSGGSGTCGGAAPGDGGSYDLPEFDPDHQAYWGYCVDNINGVLTPALATLQSQGQRPDIALVHLGTNDIVQTGQPAATVADELETLTTRLKAANSGMSVLMAQLIPIQPTASVENVAVQSLNGEIAGMAGITAVDQYDGFGAGDAYDALHPNDAGEARVAARWLDAIKAILP